MALYGKSGTKVATLVIILLAAVAVGFGWHVLVQRSSEEVEAHMPNSSGVLTVKQVSERPEGFAGQIKILGVVSQIEKDQALIGLVDKAEGLSCLGGECSDCLLPVSWDGPMPEVGESIIVTGQIESSSQGLVVAASRVDRQ
jgi:hypothetical protein